MPRAFASAVIFVPNLLSSFVQRPPAARSRRDGALPRPYPFSHCDVPSSLQALRLRYRLRTVVRVHETCTCSRAIIIASATRQIDPDKVNYVTSSHIMTPMISSDMTCHLSSKTPSCFCLRSLGLLTAGCEARCLDVARSDEDAQTAKVHFGAIAGSSLIAPTGPAFLPLRRGAPPVCWQTQGRNLRNRDQKSIGN